MVGFVKFNHRNEIRMPCLHYIDRSKTNKSLNFATLNHHAR
ncbi:hypothetical protein V6Z11_A12G109300 [Gossypium hirsutum]